MQINLDLPSNIISNLLSILSWIAVLFLVRRQYVKQQEKPVLWKALLVTFAGLFAFTINLNLFETMAKIPVLPLGLWIAYGFLRTRSWGKYRKYAWIGFSANFIFLAAALISTPIQDWVYPKTEVSTYIANIKNATILGIHPSASTASLNKEQLSKELHQLQPAEVMSIDWYQQSTMESEPGYQQERFPYQLIGTKSRWGSGIATVIYVEDDGKGILITTASQQYYYRSNEPLVEMEALQDE